MLLVKLPNGNLPWIKHHIKILYKGTIIYSSLQLTSKLVLAFVISLLIWLCYYEHFTDILCTLYILVPYHQVQALILCKQMLLNRESFLPFFPDYEVKAVRVATLSCSRTPLAWPRKRRTRRRPRTRCSTPSPATRPSWRWGGVTPSSRTSTPRSPPSLPSLPCQTWARGKSSPPSTQVRMVTVIIGIVMSYI